VHPKDLLPPQPVRPLHRHAAVEAPGAQQRGVQDVRPIGRGDADDGRRLLVRLKAIQLGQKLVQRLLPLVVAHGAQPRVAALRDGVDFINENDGGRLLAGGRKQLAHAHRAHACVF